MTHDIFISYSRKDLKQVITIRDMIKEKLGAESWIDIKGIESGEQFVNVIVRAIAEAVKWFSMTAEKGLANAQSSLGYCYLNGEGIGQNYKKAFEWFEKAALQNSQPDQRPGTI